MAHVINKAGSAIGANTAGRTHQPPNVSSGASVIRSGKPSGHGVQADPTHRSGQPPSVPGAAGRSSLAIDTGVPKGPRAGHGTPTSNHQPQSSMTEPTGSAKPMRQDPRPPTPAPGAGGNGAKQRVPKFAEASSLAPPVVKKLSKISDDRATMHPPNRTAKSTML